VQWAAGAFAAVTAWLAARWNVPPVFPERRASDVTPAIAPPPQ
jgi:hypothetical protein